MYKTFALSVALTAFIPAMASGGIFMEAEQETRSVSGALSGNTTRVRVVMKVEEGWSRIDLYMLDFPGGNETPFQTVLQQKGAEESLFLFPDKTYWRMTKEDADRNRRQMHELFAQTGNLPSSRPTLTATGKKKTVDARTLEEYSGTTATGKITAWIDPSTKAIQLELAAVATMPGAEINTMQFPDPASLPGVPFEQVIESTHPGPPRGPSRTPTTSTTVTTMRVTKLEERDFPDSEFKVPDGFKLRDWTQVRSPFPIPKQ